MKYVWFAVLAGLLALATAIAPEVRAGPYLQDDDEGLPLEDEYSENALDRFLQTAENFRYQQMKRDDQAEGKEKTRACVRRGGNCDHRPNDCCYNSSCRCNLWGSNCRCQRMGLFQKWG